MVTKNRRQTTANENKDELDRLRTDKVIADVVEGFAEIERGEYVVMTEDDCWRR